MAMQPKNASDIITFTRSTAAWEWDWQGNYSEVAAGVMRIAHDPLTKSTSTTPQTLGTGSYTFAVTYQYQIGKAVRVSADAANWMVGRVTASSPTSVTILVSSAPVGAGTYSSWTLIVRRGIRVEEQRTNLLTRSSNVADVAWGKAACTTSPAGSSPGGLPAEKITPVAGAGNHYYGQAAGFAGAVDNGVFSLSLRIKADGYNHFHIQGKTKSDLYPAANVDLAAGTITLINASGSATASIEPLPGGWYLCSLSWSVLTGAQPLSLFLTPKPTAMNSVSFTADGVSGALVSGHQLEPASVKSSHIPTGASQVIRAGDVPLVNTLAPWFNAVEGLLVTKFIRDSIGPSQTMVALSGVSNSSMTLESGSGVPGQLRLRVNDSSVQQAIPIGAPSSAAGVSIKVAGAYAANYFAASVNGAAPAIDTDGSVPSATRLEIGQLNGVAKLNGIIEDITYYPRVIDTQQASA